MDRQTNAVLCELAQRNQIQGLLLDMVQHAIIATDIDGTVVYLNRCAEELYGWTTAQCANLTVVDFLPFGETPERTDDIMARLSSGESWSGELVSKRRDGTTFLAAVTASPIFDAEQSVIGFVGLSFDVTEQKRTEEALKESEELYRLITENSIDLITLVDLEGRYVYVSPSHATLGYRPDEMVGNTLFGYMHPDDQPTLADAWTYLLTHGTAQATGRFRHADGSWRWLEAFGTAIQRDGAFYIVSVARDITARVHLEAQLRQAQKAEQKRIEAARFPLSPQRRQRLLGLDLDQFGARWGRTHHRHALYDH